MSERLSPEEIDQLARRRAGAKMGWFSHAAVYAIVNTMLYLMSDHGFGVRPWSLAPLLGWGLGLALHGVSVFVLGKGSSFREGLVRKERERLQREQDGR
jgi:hypothetical protein